MNDYSPVNRVRQTPIGSPRIVQTLIQDGSTSALATGALNPLDPTSGAIGSPSTTVLLGNQSYDLTTRYGGRFTLGGWFHSEGLFGVEANPSQPRGSSAPAAPNSPYGR